MNRAAVWLSAASVLFTLTHSFEDFHHAIYARFGLDLLPAAFLLSVAYAAQLLLAVGAWHGSRVALLGNAALAGTWLVGAAVDHLPEVLASEPYRAGLISKGLEVGIMVMAAAWLATALLAWRDRRPAVAAEHRTP